MVQKIRAPLQLPPVIEEYISSLNRVDVRFVTIVTSNFCLLSLKVSLLSCLLLVIPFLLHSSSSIFKVFLL